MDLFPKPGELGLDPIDAGLFGASLLVVGLVAHLVRAAEVLQGAPGIALGAALLKGRRFVARRRLKKIEMVRETV